MPFDDSTRGRLQSFVGTAHDLLAGEFAWQLQQTYGLDPTSGEVAGIDRLAHLDDQRLETARILREILDHYLGAAANPTVQDRRHALDRIVREQAFTVLNRLAALRLMEARGILLESVAQGYQSKAFQLYQRVAGAALGETGDAYRVFLFSLFDRFAADLPALFDRHSPFGRLFPREATFLRLLDLLNGPELEPLWGEDETIGWIYQYFNSTEERRRMRKESGAPRNSRELAVRNQFFTPRYVVEFLVDNALARQWIDMSAGRSALADRAGGGGEICREPWFRATCDEILRRLKEPKPKTALNRYRPLRDPRTLKLLDPACGSMHFGLYAFDLFDRIYREAWAWEEAGWPAADHRAAAPGLKPLHEVYADEAAFLRDLPRLILEHNIYGVDIDPRAAQIASLALWLRAQRAWNDDGVRREARPAVGRGQVVAAVAPPAEADLRRDLMAGMDELDAELFERTLRLLKGLPELGVLLRAEREVPALVRQVFGSHGDLFRREDEAQWRDAETRLRAALADFAHSAAATYRSRLFAEDALEGLRLIDLVGERFDAVVMNPPFGALSAGVKDELGKAYPRSKNDLLAIFVERGLEVMHRGGRIGAITSRTCFFLTSYQKWREEVVLGIARPEVMADLGVGVMDDAMVEAAAYVLEKQA